MRDPAAHVRVEDHGASALYETDRIDGEAEERLNDLITFPNLKALG